MTGDSNGENNVMHEILLTDRQVSRLCKAFTKLITKLKLIKKINCLTFYN